VASASVTWTRATARPVAVPEHRTADDGQHARLDKRTGDLPAGGREDTAERRTGDPHPLGGLHVVESLHVREAYGLQFVETERDNRQPPRGPADRPEPLATETAADTARYRGASHGSYEYMLETEMCQQLATETASGC